MSKSADQTGPGTDATTTGASGSALPWLWGLTLLLIVGSSAIGGYVWLERSGGATPNAEGTTPDAIPLEPQTLTPDRDYYVQVKLAELRPTRADGDPWDWWDETAPDVYYIMKWQDVQVFESVVRDDDFVARWDLLGADVRDVVTGVVTGSAAEMDIESLINAQPIHVQADTTITIEIWESDRLDDELVATLPIKLADQREGTTRFRFTEEEQPELARLELTIIDCATPLPELLEMVGQR
ncbi:MAG: hypothetical protein AAGF84_06980 [Planctomycetota bacterium]